MDPQIITTTTNAATSGLKAVSEAGTNNSILFGFLVLVGTITFLLWQMIKDNKKQVIEMTKITASLDNISDNVKDLKTQVNTYVTMCNRREK